MSDVKTALVTGANRGIGREVVRQLASRGYKVFLGARDEARGQKAVEEIRAEGLSDVHFVALDVTQDESVKQAASVIASQVSALDVLVNNAGGCISGFQGPLEESIDDISATFDLNVNGVIRTTRAFIELLKKSEGARIVNVGSAAGSLTQISDPSVPFYHFNNIAYMSTKSALNSVTVSFAKLFSGSKIKVNVACPGNTLTELNPNQPGAHSVEVGARIIITLATLPDDGPTGTFQNMEGIIPW